mmetsp:Transcript_52211/g.137871  ORF Transcript_52211/g.137871 Transcript_52211/m.137871 type:complete len:453 (+) Transcript_52211:958-2316(+)
MQGRRGSDVAAVAKQRGPRVPAVLAAQRQRRDPVRKHLVDECRQDPFALPHLQVQHVLRGQEVALPIVPAEDEVVLAVELAELDKGRKLYLPHLFPGAGSHALGRQSRPCAAPQLSRQQRGGAVHPALLHEAAEELVAVVLGEVLVDVGPGGQEDDVAGGDLRVPAPVQEAEQGKASRVDDVPGIPLVAAGRELAAARVERVVDVAEHLDSRRLVPTVLADLPRLRREVLQDLGAEALRPDVLVDQLVQVEVVAAAVDQVLELGELLAPASDDDAVHRLLASLAVAQALLLQGVEKDGLGDGVEKALLHRKVGELPDGVDPRHLEERADAHVGQHVRQLALPAAADHLADKLVDPLAQGALHPGHPSLRIGPQRQQDHLEVEERPCQDLVLVSAEPDQRVRAHHEDHKNAWRPASLHDRTAAGGQAFGHGLLEVTRDAPSLRRLRHGHLSQS